MHGWFSLVRVVTATAFCALEAFHGLPTYLVVLLMGLAGFVIDLILSPGFALDTLRHMPWELFSFVTSFLILAEAMSITGVYDRELCPRVRSQFFSECFIALCCSKEQK